MGDPSSTPRVSKKNLSLCDQRGRQELEPFFVAARNAQQQGKPGIILAQVRPDHTGDGVFLEVRFFSHDQGKKLIDLVKEFGCEEES